MKKKMFGCCGIVCSDCPGFLAFQNDDDLLREKTAKEWSKAYGHSFTKEMINCSGCLAKKGPQCGFCGICPIRSCASKKKKEECLSCKEFSSCTILDQMQKETGTDFRQKSHLRKNEK